MTTTPQTSREIETYNETVRSTFAFLKATERLDDLFAKSVRLEENLGTLLPVAELHADDAPLIETLGAWRERSSFAFPTQFPVSAEGTTRWLRAGVLDREDRLLFLVLDRHGHAVGHVGLANAINDACEIEMDNIVRGVDGVAPGIMSAAMRALATWAIDNLAPSRIFLRVFSDNERAVAFYERLGYERDGLQPLRRAQDGDAVRYEPTDEADGPADKHFLRMVLRDDEPVTGETMILTAGPHISPREASYALDAARFGWNNRWSRYIKGFEEAFGEYVGTRYALSTSSCTGALHLALLACGIGPGDEVIVPDITWVATANAVGYAGATPVFADVEREGWTLDAASFEARITERTKAVMPVHLYGHPARMEPIMEIARRHDLRVIEDAAPAIGAEDNGRKTGTFGDFAGFSFQGAKLLVTGEGGMLVTDDGDLFERVRHIWDQGRDPNTTFWIDGPGWKYKMSNVQAAIGLGQLQQIEHLIDAKRRLFHWYAEDLEGTPFIELSHEREDARSIHWMTSILLSEDAPVDREELRAQLKARNVDTRPVFPAISQYPIWERRQEPQPTALHVGRHAINLPSGVLLRREQIRYVASTIKEILGHGDH